MALGMFQAEARDPRLQKRKVQPASKYRSPNNRIPTKQKKFKTPKLKRVKFKKH